MPVAEALARLRAQRDEAMREIGQIGEKEVAYPAQWNGVNRNVNFLIRVLALHDIDHLQHAQRLLMKRGRVPTEAQLLLAKAQALRGEIEALLAGLTDEDFDAPAAEGDWSMAQLVDHLAQVDANYLKQIRAAITAGREASQTTV